MQDGRPRYISPNLGSRGTFQASPGIRAGVHEIGGKFQVSTNAVNCPPWRFDGNELFCRSPDSKMMAVEVKATAIYHVLHRRVDHPKFHSRPRTKWQWTVPRLGLVNDSPV